MKPAVPPAGAPELPLGQRVRIHGLASRADLNGAHAFVAAHVPARDRYQVRTEQGGQMFSLKASSLAPARGVLGALDGELFRAFVLPCFDADFAVALSAVCRSWHAQVHRASAFWKDCCVRLALDGQQFVKTAPNFGQPVRRPRGGGSGGGGGAEGGQADASVVVSKIPRSLDAYIAEDFNNKELRRMLFFAGIDSSQCVELADFRQRVRLYLLLGDPNLTYDWASKMDEWQATLFYLRRDKARTKLTKEEAVAMDWAIQFRQRGAHRELSAGFNEDGTMWSDLQPDARHTWDVVQREDGCYAVQVAQYPPLYITRDADGSWTMSNEYVSLISKHGDARAGDRLPRQHAEAHAAAE